MYDLYKKPTVFQPAFETRRSYKGNIYRHLLADAIEKNGGYNRHYHDRAALSWNVSVDWSIPDFDEIKDKALVSDYGPGADVVIEESLLETLKEEWDDDGNQSKTWYWVLEQMREGVTDADTYRTVRPEIAARYGLHYHRFPKKYKRRTNECAFYPAKKDGWMLADPLTVEYFDVEYFDVEWEFMGRQGKHLCLTSFEGKSLNYSADDLAENIRQEGNEDYSNQWCQKLLAFIHECDLCFDNKSVKAEFEHAVLYELAGKLSEAADESVALAKEAAERQWAAERDIMTV